MLRLISFRVICFLLARSLFAMWIFCLLFGRYVTKNSLSSEETSVIYVEWFYGWKSAPVWSDKCWKPCVSQCCSSGFFVFGSSVSISIFLSQLFFFSQLVFHCDIHLLRSIASSLWSSFQRLNERDRLCEFTMVKWEIPLFGMHKKRWVHSVCWFDIVISHTSSVSICFVGMFRCVSVRLSNWYYMPPTMALFAGCYWRCRCRHRCCHH